MTPAHERFLIARSLSLPGLDLQENFWPGVPTRPDRRRSASNRFVLASASCPAAGQFRVRHSRIDRRTGMPASWCRIVRARNALGKDLPVLQGARPGPVCDHKTDSGNVRARTSLNSARATSRPSMQRFRRSPRKAKVGHDERHQAFPVRKLAPGGAEIRPFAPAPQIGLLVLAGARPDRKQATGA